MYQGSAVLRDLTVILTLKTYLQVTSFLFPVQSPRVFFLPYPSCEVPP